MTTEERREIWLQRCQQEAHERCYRIAFVGTDAGLWTALFFNGPIFCYARQFDKDDPQW